MEMYTKLDEEEGGGKTVKKKKKRLRWLTSSRLQTLSLSIFFRTKIPRVLKVTADVRLFNAAVCTTAPYLSRVLCICDMNTQALSRTAFDTHGARSTVAVGNAV